MLSRPSACRTAEPQSLEPTTVLGCAAALVPTGVGLRAAAPAQSQGAARDPARRDRLAPLARVVGAHVVLDAGRQQQHELVAKQVHDPAELEGLHERLAAGGRQGVPSAGASCSEAAAVAGVVGARGYEKVW